MTAKIQIPYVGPFRYLGIARTLSGTYVCPGWFPVPEGTTLADVELNFDLRPEMKKLPVYVKLDEPEYQVVEVNSASSDKVYKVTFSEQFGNSCSCAGFGFRKHCKHIEIAKLLR